MMLLAVGLMLAALVVFDMARARRERRRMRVVVVVLARSHSGEDIAQVLGSDRWHPGPTPAGALAAALNNTPELAGPKPEHVEFWPPTLEKSAGK